MLNSFSEKTLLLYSPGEIILEGKYIEGNIKIVSEKRIEIKSSSTLNDILVYAPAVKICNGFKGSLQVYATDSVSLGKGCNLNYPSVIGVFVSENDSAQPYIRIRNRAKVNGVVFLYGKKKSSVFKPYIQIDPDALVSGQVVCTDNIQLCGKVEGSVFCNNFILKTSSSYYEQIIIDGAIDFNALPVDYAGISSDKNNERRKPIKWLY
mgnify:FL=1